MLILLSGLIIAGLTYLLIHLTRARKPARDEGLCMELDAPATAYDVRIDSRKDTFTVNMDAIRDLQRSGRSEWIKFVSPGEVDGMPTGGSTFTVAYLDQPVDELKPLIKEAAQEWERLVGVHFLFDSEPATLADIRISFDNEECSSLIGRQSTIGVPTMKLGRISYSWENKEIKRVVMHEFGHALGMLHEVQNPALPPINWNIPKLKAYCWENYGWDDDERIRRNFIDRYGIPSGNHSEFDSLSIMLYYIPEDLVNGHFPSRHNDIPSAIDVEYLRARYGMPG